MRTSYRQGLACPVIVLLAVGRCALAAETDHIVTVGNARFTVIAPECVRLEYSASAKFTDEPSLFAVDRSAAFTNFTLSREANATTIDTGKIRLTYTPDDKPFHADNLRAQIASGIGWRAGQRNAHNLGGTLRTLDQVRGPVDLGEGLLSREGWYVLDDSKRHVLTDEWVRCRPNDAGMDWYLFGYGSDYRAALRAMTKIGGPVPMPRRYTLGSWYSRWWPYTSADYRKIVREYQQHDFPLDVIVLDMDWHKDGWTGWSWNRKLLPDAEDLLKWFHQQRLFVTLNVHPADGVGPHEDAYVAFMRQMGEDPSTKKVLPYDAGSKKYLDALFKHTHVPLEKAGVDFWWLDWQQYEFTRSIPDLANLTWLNHHYYEHSGSGDRRGLSFSRWGGWGDHRHPIHFSGDATTDWSTLAFEVPFTSTAGNVGCFFWSHDIGGHFGARNEESFVRWVQFGATTAALRLHSGRIANLDRRPWTYSRLAEDATRIAFHLRSQLTPYIYSSVWQCHRDSLPLNRPMYLEYPDKGEAYRNAQQYFFGDTFLVAPIVSAGVGSNKVARQVVWFPEGAWYNWFTGEKYAGNQERIVSADLNEFPLYVKGGVPIPLQPYTPRMTTEPLCELIVRCYPGQTGSFTLYEDDGITKDYLAGKYALTELSYRREGTTNTVTISPAKGTFAGQPASRAYGIELPGTAKPESVTLDGKPAEVEYDERTSLTRVRVASRPITEAVTVSVTTRDASKSVTPLTGYFRKNEAPYLFGGTARGLIYFGDEHRARIRVEDSLGTDTTEVVAQNFESASGQPMPVPDLPGLTKAPDRGRAARRILYFEGRATLSTNVLEQLDYYLTHWSVAGPFDFDPDKDFAAQKYGPERGVIPRWQKAQTNPEHAVDLRKLFNFDNKIAYAVTYLHSEQPQKITFKINSDDGFALWLNGEQLATVVAGRPIDHVPNVAQGTLRPGRNTLLLKISQYSRDWGFKIGVDCAYPLRESEF